MAKHDELIEMRSQIWRCKQSIVQVLAGGFQQVYKVCSRVWDTLSTIVSAEQSDPVEIRTHWNRLTHYLENAERSYGLLDPDL